MTQAAEVLPELWRFTARHPDWTQTEGGEDGWDPDVAWWAVQTPRGVVLVDPLVDDWDVVDELVAAHGRCAGIVRMIHWHERSCAEAAVRYGTSVWAGPPVPRSGDDVVPAPDHILGDGVELWDAVRSFSVQRDDEVALWLPGHAALLFADAMIGSGDGRLRLCPESWRMPPGGFAQLQDIVRGLGRLSFQHVLVSHGPSPQPGTRTEFDAAVR